MAKKKCIVCGTPFELNPDYPLDVQELCSMECAEEFDYSQMNPDIDTFSDADPGL